MTIDRSINQAGRLVTLVLLGLTLASLNIRPAGAIEFTLLGSPLTINLSGATLITVLLVLMTCAGVEAMVRLHPWLNDAPLAYTAIFWPLPAVVTLTAALIVPTLFGRPIWLIGLAAAFVGQAVVLLGQYQAIDPDARYYDRARLLLTLLAYGSAFLLYAAVLGLHLRAIISASSILLISVPLALTLVRGSADEWRRAWIYAIVCGVVVGEITWVLTYWPIGSIGTAALLLLTFYIVTNLAQQALASQVTRRVLIEFLVFGALAFILVVRFSPWLE
ncbi:MAG: hypothetical protein U0641_06080 [Anaerolineae bacterium]